jgi:CspA family cold shock protein
MPHRFVGTVKYFNRKSGYGFITRDGHEDVFVHFSQIRGEWGFKYLKKGDSVEFQVGKSNYTGQNEAKDVTLL